jgi:hypothetical protein
LFSKEFITNANEVTFVMKSMEERKNKNISFVK